LAVLQQMMTQAECRKQPFDNDTIYVSRTQQDFTTPRSRIIRSHQC